MMTMARLLGVVLALGALSTRANDSVDQAPHERDGGPMLADMIASMEENQRNIDTLLGRDAGGSDIAAIVAQQLPPAAPSLDLPVSDFDSKGEDLNLGWTLARTALVLGIVVSLIYLTLNVGLRKLLGIKPATSHGLVTVLERVTLDQKRALFVVRAGSEVLLLGGSDSNLELITKLDPAEVERLQSQPAAPLTMSPLLQKLLGARKKS